MKTKPIYYKSGFLNFLHLPESVEEQKLLIEGALRREYIKDLYEAIAKEIEKEYGTF